MQISSVRPTPRSNKLYVQVPHHQLAQNLMTRSLWQNISRIQGQKLLLFSVNVIVWENSRHLASPPWVSPRRASEWRAQKFHTDDVSPYWSGACLQVAMVTLASGLKIARVYKQWFHGKGHLITRVNFTSFTDVFCHAWRFATSTIWRKTWRSLWRTR